MLQAHVLAFLSMLKGSLHIGTDRKASLDVTLPVKGPVMERNLLLEFWAAPSDPFKDSVTGMAIKGGLKLKLDPSLQPIGGSGGPGPGYSATFSYALPKGPLSWEDSLGSNMVGGFMLGTQPIQAFSGRPAELLPPDIFSPLFKVSPLS